MSKSKLIAAVALALSSLAAHAGGTNDTDRIDPTYAGAGLTREAVRAQLAAAQARGEVLLGDARIAQPAQPSLRSRAEVRAELAEAQRLGLVLHSEGDALIATPAQQARIDMAGRDAAVMASSPAREG